MWVLAGALGLGLFLYLYERAFPEASVQDVISRERAVEASRSVVQSRGYALKGYRHAVVFRGDQGAKTFLEKSLGLVAADALMTGEIAVWRWRTRWYKPQQSEEFSVSLSPAGRLIGYAHAIPEDRAAPGLDEPAALERAETFLDLLPRQDVSSYRLLETRQRERPNRLDHIFLWERDGFVLNGSSYRVRVIVQGNEVGYYSEYLHIPEDWTLAETQKDGQRVLYYTVASAAYGVLMLLVYIVFLLRLRRLRLQFRFAALLGGLLAVLSIVERLNDLPSAWMTYETTQSVAAFLGYQSVDMVLAALGALFTILVLGAAGDALAREAFPNRAPLSRMLTREYWVCKEVFTASFVGCCLAFVHAAYVSLFYVAGSKVGVWSPLLAPGVDILGTPLPWLYPLTVGLSASLNEELLFRLFAISLIVRYLKRPWLAVVAPAIVWGFLHSAYPQEPAYTRGIELTLVGIAFGVVFLRYGLLTSVVSHYAYNALLSSMVMLRSGESYLQLSGVIVVGLMVAPALPGLSVLARRKKFASLPAPVTQPYPDPSRLFIAAVPAAGVRYAPYAPLPLFRYAILLVVGGMAFWAAPRVQEERFGDFIEMKVNRLEAERIAADHLRGLGVDEESFQRVTTFRNRLSGREIDFLHDQVGAKELNAVCQTHLRGSVAWETRFYVPLNPEEYLVSVLPSGEVFGTNRVVTNESAGGAPTEVQARRAAERFLTETHGLDLAEYRLVDSSSHQLPNRMDHSFVWQFAEGPLEQGAFQVYVPVVGDDAHYAFFYVDIPDDWIRAREERNVGNVVFFAAMILFGAMAMMILGGVFMVFFVRGDFRWPVGIACAASFCVAETALWLNGLPTLWRHYPIEIGPMVYLSEELITFATELVAVFAMVCISAVFAEALLRKGFPELPPIGRWNPLRPNPPDGSRPWLGFAWGEALVIAASVCVAAAALPSLAGAIWGGFPAGAARWPAFDGPPVPTFPGGSDSWLPALTSLCRSLQAAVAGAIALAAVAGFYRLHTRSLGWLAVFSLSALAALAGVDSIGFVDFMTKASQAILASVLGVAVVYGLVRWVTRANLASYFTTLFALGIFLEGLSLASVPNPLLAGQGLFLLGLWAMALAAGLFLMRSSPKPAKTDAP